ncbi:MAG: polysaccharide deacetylase family protein [Alphaproteobacteria bacterium]|nr:polysaccharide deacetylase family protein [Alphaproteobacteria bacterium]MCW5741111.1 polysaccharide deacetylase family protein [Alphaproteobacteria bacterium]
MSAWRELDEELARWSDLGRVATLWWRDDDASDATPALDRLLALQARHDVGLALAVIPERATAALSARLADAAGTAVLQHGYAHQNHAAAGEKKTELGPHRPAMVVLGELGTGWMALERFFGARALPVMVPPWNRIAPALVPILPEIGLRGLSTFGPRRRMEPVRGLCQVNTHVDPVDWRGGRGFVGEQAAVASLTRSLAIRRLGGFESAVGEETTGLLTHHLVQDEAVWAFIERLIARLRAHSGVRILAPQEVFGLS